MSRLAHALGDGTRAWYAAAMVTALLFGALHLQRGTMTGITAGGLGLLFGIVYLRADRNLWVVIAAHSIYDTVRAVQYFLS